MNKLIFKILLSVLMIVNMASLVISCGNSKNNLKETISTENISSDEYVNEEISADEGMLYNYKMNSDGTWSAAGFGAICCRVGIHDTRTGRYVRRRVAPHRKHAALPPPSGAGTVAELLYIP